MTWHADNLLGRDDVVGARDWAEAALAKGVENSLSLMGLVCEREGDAEAARQWYEKGADAGEDVGMAERGMALLAEDKPAEALEWLLPRAQYDPFTQAQLAVAYIELEDWDQAKEWAGRSAAEDDVLGHFALGAVLEELGDDDAAMPHYQFAAEGGESDAMHAYASLLEKTGSPLLAAHWFEEAAYAADDDDDDEARPGS